MPDDQSPQLFLKDQKLFRLKDGLPDDQRKSNACSSSFDKDAWEFTSREDVCQEILSDKPPPRVALVCDAGLGKTTNMEWLQAHLADPRGRQLPILVRLDTSTPPDRSCGIEVFEQELKSPSGNHILDWLTEDFAAAGAGGDRAHNLAALKRLQLQGRLTLLIDGLDHAISNANIQAYLSRFLASAPWRQCPIWIAGRPNAFETRWDNDIFRDPEWQFRRVGALEEAEIRFYMSQCAGGDWYDEIQGKELLRIPRFLRLICGIIRGKVIGLTNDDAKRKEVRQLDFSTGAAVYWKAFFELGNPKAQNPHRDTLGLLLQGMQDKAERLGLDGNEIPLRANRGQRVERAAAVLGAIAFQMFDTPNRAPQFTGTSLDPLLSKAGQRFADNQAGILPAFHRDFDFLMDMNIHTLDFLLFRESNQVNLTFRDRTTMAFFAAYWACHCALPEKLQVTRGWVVDDLFKVNPDYREFWQFAAEMPGTPLPKNFNDATSCEDRWLALFTPLYDGSVKDPMGRPIRSTEFIYRSWQRMEKTNRKVCQNFQMKPGSDKAGIEVGFIRLVGTNKQKDDGIFEMGAPPTEDPEWDEKEGVQDNPLHKVTLSHYCLHSCCVTNLEYELFDPRHRERRWRGKHPLADAVKGGDDRCAVVKVNWYDAWCFARWVGTIYQQGKPYVVGLPTEAQWEYGCRCGHHGEDYTPFTYDKSRDGKSCQSGDCNFDGGYPFPSKAEIENGKYLKCTLPVDGEKPPGMKAGSWKKHKLEGIKPNLWEFYQMHGNVCEWCQDWYSARFYRSVAASKQDPENVEEASARVLRGGSWSGSAGFCRSAIRSRLGPDGRLYDYGFRLAAVPADGAKQDKRSVGDEAASVVERSVTEPRRSRRSGAGRQTSKSRA